MLLVLNKCAYQQQVAITWFIESIDLTINHVKIQVLTCILTPTKRMASLIAQAWFDRR